MPANLGAPLGSGLGDLFDLTGGVGTLSGSYVAPKTVSGTAEPHPLAAGKAYSCCIKGGQRPPCRLPVAGPSRESGR